MVGLDQQPPDVGDHPGDGLAADGASGSLAHWHVAHETGIPAHAQIATRIAELITSGELVVGERLPAERVLADRIGVSRMTLRHALASLEARGLIERGVGRGTFVAQPKLDYAHTRMAGLSERLRRSGLEPGARLVSCHERAAPLGVAAALSLADDERVVCLERVRLGDQEVITLEESWLPASRVPGLCDRDLTGSLYTLLGTEYGAEPVRAVERLEPVLATAREAEALDVREGSPLMLVERIAYIADGTPIEFARDRHRGDRARFVLEIGGSAGD